ncbi:hypothetical protein PBC6_029 [Bacillus phage PBC6]|nr:hypothetical protein PBC6_029 [Bacillus phage PBC6]
MLGKHPSGSDVIMYFKNPDGTMTRVGEMKTITATVAKGKSRFPTIFEGSITVRDASFELNDIGKKVQELGFNEPDAWTISTFYGEEGYKNIKKLVKMGFSPRAAFNIHRTKGSSWKEGKNGR